MGCGGSAKYLLEPKEKEDFEDEKYIRESEREALTRAQRAPKVELQKETARAACEHAPQAFGWLVETEPENWEARAK